MLQHLHISNYAIIEEMVLSFDEGLNILTGDTGAGKSIILDALSLVLGERMDSASILDTNKKSIVEATFSIKNQPKVQAFLAARQLTHPEDPNIVILRREMNPKTKVSRAFINDTVAVLGNMSEAGDLLIDLHQQFDTLQLNQQIFQISILDSLSENQELLKEYKKIYHSYAEKKRAFQAEEAQLQKTMQQREELQFICDELNALAFKSNEIEDIESELKIAEKGVALREICQHALNFLKENDTSALRELNYIVKQFNHYADHQKTLAQIVARLDSVYLELEDIAHEITAFQERTYVDEKRTAHLQNRLSEGFRLLRKYNLKTTNELLDFYEKNARLLASLTHSEEHIEKERKALEALLKQVLFLANELSFQRNKQAKQLEADLQLMLANVGMGGARIRIEVNKKTREDINELGMDNVSFLIDTNKTSFFEPIGKIASGGELSRVMLILKSIVGKNLALPTLVFDEIDTGVSGEIAKQIGTLLHDTAKNMQIICITHQPTIAARGKQHLHLFKEEKNNRINTCVKKLSPEERITQIALMLGGDNPSAQVLEVARKMIYTEQS